MNLNKLQATGLHDILKVLVSDYYKQFRGSRFIKSY